MNEKFVKFYNNVDRKEKYSKNVSMEYHPFYKELRAFIENFSLHEKKCLEIGSGTGCFQNIVNDYTGVDVANSLRKFYSKEFYVIDEEKGYDFNDNTFDFIFSYACFEHIPNIDQILNEMTRVLKNGGFILFRPAWNVRPWASKGYSCRSYSELNFKEKLGKFLVPIRENYFFRASQVLPVRIIYLLIYFFNRSFFSKSLIYKKLCPNYDVFYQSDSDACNSLDPFLLILYFKANNLEVLNLKSLIRGIFWTNGSLIIKK
jgi:SAM-dependent methyltransferase